MNLKEEKNQRLSVRKESVFYGIPNQLKAKKGKKKQRFIVLFVCRSYTAVYVQCVYTFIYA